MRHASLSFGLGKLVSIGLERLSDPRDAWLFQEKLGEAVDAGDGF
jgi:hypothetical protein